MAVHVSVENRGDLTKVDTMLKIFNSRVYESGVLKEYLDRQYYVKKSEKRHEKNKRKKRG